MMENTMNEHEVNPLVGIVMGSDSDLAVMEEAFQVMETYGIPYEARILSAHRSPEATAEYARTAIERGLQVLIAGAGWAAHLAGAIAAATTLPVIGVPIASSSLKGLDALLATVQMPPGVPVATMAIGKGGARNAAILAVQILALKHPELAAKYQQQKSAMATKVLAQNKQLDEYLANRESIV